MYRAPGTLVTLLVVALVLTTAAPGGAQGRSVVSVTAGDGALTVAPLVAYDYLGLRVSTPDGRVFQAEGSGGAVAFRPFAIPGYTPPEGSYIWEILLTPQGAISRELREQALRARESGDDNAEHALRVTLLRATVVQSGGFRILGGKLVAGGATERPARGGQSGATRSPFVPASLASGGDFILVDQVIPDDLIVQGSACIGLDCVNNESFGFDTIRLKENNLRIKFEDTSSAAGFPTNDWQLTANDSASGGLSKFSIDDITGVKTPFTVVAGAPTNSVFVDSSGRVGLRTGTPVLDLHVATGNTPAHRLEQNSSSGFTAQTWDIAGNEANFFIRDVTGGSRLPLRIRPGAPTSSLDISSIGRVGFGTASPESNVHVSAGASAFTTDVFGGFGPSPGSGPALNFGYGGSSFGRGAGFFNARPDASATAPNPSLRFMTADQQRMIITNTGNVGIGTTSPANPLQMASGAFVSAGGVWTDASSRELKDDIQSLSADEARGALLGLSPVKFAYKVDPAERHVGFIAEDVPDLVASKDRKALSPMDIVALLTRVVQEQQKTADEQQRIIADLAAKVAALEAARAAAR